MIPTPPTQPVQISDFRPSPLSARHSLYVVPKDHPPIPARHSPRGCFLSALGSLENQRSGISPNVRDIYNRDLADCRRPLNVRAVAVAMLYLTGATGGYAEEARDALCEMILEEVTA